MEHNIKKFVSPIDVNVEALNRKEAPALSFSREQSSYLNYATFVFALVEQLHIKMTWYFYYLEKDIM